MWKSGFDASFVGQSLLFLLHQAASFHNREHSCGAFYSEVFSYRLFILSFIWPREVGRAGSVPPVPSVREQRPQEVGRLTQKVQ